MLSPMAGDEPFDRLARLAARILDVPTRSSRSSRRTGSTSPARSGCRSRGPRAARPRCRTRSASTSSPPASRSRSPMRARTSASATTPPSPSSGSSPTSGCRSRRPTARSSAASAPSTSAPATWTDDDRAVLTDLCAAAATEIHLRLVLDRERRLAIDLNDDLIQHLAAAKLELQLGGSQDAAIERIGAALAVAQTTAARCSSGSAACGQGTCGHAHDGGPIRVLICDDDAAMRFLVREMLALSPLVQVVARGGGRHRGDGAAAAAPAGRGAAGPLHAAPGRAGDPAAAARRVPCDAGRRPVGLRRRPGRREQALELGADRYVQKGVDPDTLIGIVEELGTERA